MYDRPKQQANMSTKNRKSPSASKTISAKRQKFWLLSSCLIMKEYYKAGISINVAIQVREVMFNLNSLLKLYTRHYRTAILT